LDFSFVGSGVPSVCILSRSLTAYIGVYSWTNQNVELHLVWNCRPKGGKS